MAGAQELKLAQEQPVGRNNARINWNLGNCFLSPSSIWASKYFERRYLVSIKLEKIGFYRHVWSGTISR